MRTDLSAWQSSVLSMREVSTQELTSRSTEEEALSAFEALFLEELFRAMRATVPEGGAIPRSRYRELYEDEFYRHLSEVIADGGGIGLGQHIRAGMEAYGGDR